MDENLIGYLLNALDPDEHREVEAYLESHPEGRQRLEQLQQSLAPLEADRADIEPPPDLVIRTLGHVAEYCCRDLPHAPEPTTRAAASSRPLWRRADVMIAASILLLIVGLGLPWLLRLREDQALLACKNNLRLFHEALMAYAHNNKQFPDVNKEAKPPRNVAGLVVPILASDGELPATAGLRCPGSNVSCAPCVLTLEKIRDMSDEEWTQQVNQMVSCYSYSLGYKDLATGFHHGPSLVPEQQNYLPIMSDPPPLDPTTGNSSNHGRNRGQNVLYMDGHVVFCTERTVGVGGDDIFLNKDGKHKAGLDRYDTVLGRGTADP